MTKPGLAPGIMLCSLCLAAVYPFYAFNMIEWILTHFVHPLFSGLIYLLIVINISLIPVSALIIAGIFSCPNEDSFFNWLENITSIAIDLNSDQSFMTNWFSKLYFGTVLNIKMKRNFIHLGFCRIALCEMDNDQKVIFLGIFNTWFPVGG